MKQKQDKYGKAVYAALVILALLKYEPIKISDVDSLGRVFGIEIEISRATKNRVMKELAECGLVFRHPGFVWHWRGEKFKEIIKGHKNTILETISEL